MPAVGLVFGSSGLDGQQRVRGPRHCRRHQPVVRPIVQESEPRAGGQLDTELVNPFPPFVPPTRDDSEAMAHCLQRSTAPFAGAPREWVPA
jgi:hypothetical protein